MRGAMSAARAAAIPAPATTSAGADQGCEVKLGIVGLLRLSGAALAALCPTDAIATVGLPNAF